LLKRTSGGIFRTRLRLLREISQIQGAKGALFQTLFGTENSRPRTCESFRNDRSQ